MNVVDQERMSERRPFGDDVAEHLRVRASEIGRYVLLPGDPGRCEPIARLFDGPHHVATNREYVTWTGTLLGETVSVVSTGIGCPSAAIATEELSRLGADTFIRVGTSGGMQPFCGVGDLAIVSAAIRDEGTTSHYLPLEFPAVADIDVIDALREAARRTGARAHVGVSQSKDSFYGEIDPDSSPVSARLHERWQAWVRGGALCSEMEAAAIYTVAAVHGRRAGGLMLMAGNLDMPKAELEAAIKTLTLEVLIATAVEGLRVLIRRDRAARR
jgi:uridine phosphorylase